MGTWWEIRSAEQFTIAEEIEIQGDHFFDFQQHDD